MTKPTKWHVCPAKTQISLGIRPVWSESSLSAWRKLRSLATHWAHSEDWSVWADAQADLSLRWAHSHFVGFVMRRLILWARILKLWILQVYVQGGHWSRKSQRNLIFLQGQGKVREFCKLVREILNTKKVSEKSGNFIILAQNMCCSRYFDYLKCEMWKKCWFFLSLASLAWNYENLLSLEHSVPRNYLRILFVSFVELGRCILVNK